MTESLQRDLLTGSIYNCSDNTVLHAYKYNLTTIFLVHEHPSGKKVHSAVENAVATVFLHEKMGLGIFRKSVCQPTNQIGLGLVLIETTYMANCRGSGTGPADPATAGPMFSQTYILRWIQETADRRQTWRQDSVKEHIRDLDQCWVRSTKVSLSTRRLLLRL